MAQWGNQDAANNSVLWGVSNYKQNANTANQTAFFGNTTSGAFIGDSTVAQYGVDITEQTVARETGSPRPAHAGWNVRVEGTGGRAGRVSFETLVAMSSMTGDANDDAVFPDLGIVIMEQPVDSNGEAAEDDVVTFTVVAESVPTGETLGYRWEVDETGVGDAFANAAAGATYSDVNTATLSVAANTATDDTLVRVVVTLSGAEDVTSDEVLLTIT